MPTEILYKHDRFKTHTLVVSLPGNTAISVPADWTERNKEKVNKAKQANPQQPLLGNSGAAALAVVSFRLLAGLTPPTCNSAPAT